MSTFELTPEAIKYYEEQVTSTVQGRVFGLDIAGMIRKKLEEAVISPISRYTQDLLRTMEDISRAVREGDFQKFVKLMLPFILTSFGISLAFDLLQTSVFGVSINLRKTIDKIDRLINPELIVSSLIGVMVGTGIETPAKYLFNQIFTPALPDIKTLSIGFIKGYYNQDKLFKYYRAHGLPTEFHKLVLDLNDFTPSVSYIERIYRYYPIDDKVLTDWLLENGVLKEELDFWKKYLEYTVIRDELSKFESIIRDHYINGMISDRELDDFLAELKPRKSERDLLAKMWKLIKLKKIYQYYIEKNVNLYRKGVIDAEELKDRLSKFIYDTDIVEGIVLVEASKQGIDYKGRLEL